MDKKKELEIKTSKAFEECRKKAVIDIIECYYPSCHEKSINSHLLQKNGILSSITENGHLYQQFVNQFKKPPIYFELKGISKVFSFNCFCNNHDTELFKEIETASIDFNNYRHQLLLTLRTLLNEKYKKQIVLKQHEYLKRDYPALIDISKMNDWDEQEKIGLQDISKLESIVWQDLETDSKSFVYNVRELDLKQVCLSAYFTYETSQEIEEYYIEKGVHMEEINDIFISLFPYNDKSYLIMSYLKKNEKSVKGYINSFFKESIKRTERKITNILLFQCETWVCSESFFNKRIKPVEKLFYSADRFSLRFNKNERRNFDLNIFQDSFSTKLKAWYNQYVG